MTCGAARRLIPLFAGGDLKAPEMSAVADHVAKCAACRAEVEAFTAARSLLALSSLSFGQSERELLRRRVLDEIARRQGNPSLFAALLLRPQFALAALAGAVVLAASLVSPLFVRNAGEPVASLPARATPSATPAPAAERIAERIAEAAAQPPGPSSEVPRARPLKRALRPVPASERSAPAVRFEIQTGNVNVRIIWFAGGTSDGTSSGPAGDPNGVS